MSILYADKAGDVSQSIINWLSELGHTVKFVSTGEEAIGLGSKGHFDCVIVEILLPDRDGLDVIKAFKVSQPNTRIVAISAGGSYVDAGYCLKLAPEMGAHTVIMKPFTRMDLLEAINLTMAGRANEGPSPANSVI